MKTKWMLWETTFSVVIILPQWHSWIVGDVNFDVSASAFWSASLTSLSGSWDPDEPLLSCLCCFPQLPLIQCLNAANHPQSLVMNERNVGKQLGTWKWVESTGEGIKRRLTASLKHIFSYLSSMRCGECVMSSHCHHRLLIIYAT